MDGLEKYYYKQSLTLLSGIGLFPGESTVLRRIQNVSWSFIMMFGLIAQILPFITKEFSKTLVLANTPTITATMGCVLKYYTFILQSNDIKEIVKLVKHDWSTTKDDEEAKIILHHANTGQSRGAVLAKLFYISLFIFLLIELFVDQQRYFHVLAFLFDMVCIAVITVYVATESVYMMWLGHQESQFEIYAYRMRKVFLGDSVEMHVVDRNPRIIKMLAYALDMHNRAIEFSIYIHKFLWSYLILLFIGAGSLTVTLYRLSIALETSNLKEQLMCVVIYFPALAYMYYGNYVAQQVLDSYDNLCGEIYDTNWYEATVSAQKMLLFIMLRNMQPLVGKMYGMYNPSMEGFMTIMKMTFSYYMMLHSMV